MAAARPAGRRFQKGPGAASVYRLPCLEPSMTDSVSRAAWPSAKAPLVAWECTGAARRNLILREATVPASLRRRMPRPNRCAAPVTSHRRAPSQAHRTFGRHGGAAPTHSAGRVFRLSGRASPENRPVAGICGTRSHGELPRYPQRKEGGPRRREKWRRAACSVSKSLMTWFRHTGRPHVLPRGPPPGGLFPSLFRN